MVVGLDLSLSATGVCVAGTCDLIKSRKTGMERLHELRLEILGAVDGADLIVIEGYSFGTARQSGSYAIGELGGVIRFALWDYDYNVVEVPPALLKKFATGKGNASKDQMVGAAARAGCPIDDNNAVDAWWLYQMGQYAWVRNGGDGHGHDVTETAYRDEAIAKVEWTGLKHLAGVE